MIRNGKLEGRITVPGWSATLRDDSTNRTVEFAPASYADFVTMLAAIETTINEAMGQAWTVALGISEVGRVDIACSGTRCEVAWKSTDMRGRLGFSGNLSGDTMYTGDQDAITANAIVSGWTVDLTDQDAGPTTIAIPPGTYYLSGTGGLIATLQTLANAAMGQAWTVSIGAGEDGSGKVTIGCGGSTCEVAWTDYDTTLRDLLTFTGDLTGATSYTAPNHARALWLPDCPVTSPYGSYDHGRSETDARSIETAAGHVSVQYSQRKHVQSLRWDLLGHHKARAAGEVVPGESLEAFWRQVVLGELAGIAGPGGPIRFYPDAGDDTRYGEYKAPAWFDYDTTAVRDGWTGLWQVRIDRLVLVPGTGGAALVAP